MLAIHISGMSKINKAYNECLRRIYTEATPPADWSTMDKEGEFYLNYKIAQDRAVSIIEEVLKEYKIPVWRRESVKFNLYLGPTPIFSKL